VDWAWYSGGWSNAAGNVGEPGWTNGSAPLAPNAKSAAPCPDPKAMASAVWPNCPDVLFQFHHQAFNYFAAYAPGTAARAQHLRDEAEFIAAARAGTLQPVSFVKPIGEENEHPGYANVKQGSQHLRELLEAIDAGPEAEHTLTIVTYDEFGGAWDHVPPPGQGGAPGPHDAFGPGTRVPALLVSRHFQQSAVEHAQYDTTSILATIERRFRLAPVGETYSTEDARPRDAQVRDLLHE
jgi:phospholipase C